MKKRSIILVLAVLGLVLFLLYRFYPFFSDESKYRYPGMSYGFDQKFGTGGVLVALFSDGKLYFTLIYGGESDILIEELKVFDVNSKECKVESLQTSGYAPLKIPFSMKKKDFFDVEAQCDTESIIPDESSILNVTIEYEEEVGSQLIEKNTSGSIKTGVVVRKN